MAYHHRNGVIVEITAWPHKEGYSEVRVQAPGIDSYRFYTDKVATAHKRLSETAIALEAEGYDTASATLHEMAQEVFPVASIKSNDALAWLLSPSLHGYPSTPDR